MKKNLIYLWTILLTLSYTGISCGKDDNNFEDDEEELITTVRVTMAESGAGTVSTFTFKDIDGPGGLAPSVFDSIVVNANRNYSVSVQFLNESVSPTEDITTEVVAEGLDHQVYYQATAVVIQPILLNTDGIGLPLGTTCSWNTGAQGIGKMLITLKHKPGTKADGDTVDKGETDVAVDFPVRLK